MVHFSALQCLWTTKLTKCFYLNGLIAPRDNNALRWIEGKLGSKLGIR